MRSPQFSNRTPCTRWDHSIHRRDCIMDISLYMTYIRVFVWESQQDPKKEERQQEKRHN